MPTPRLFFGSTAHAALLEADSGYTDDGVPYNLRAKSQRQAPAGVSGEAIFTALYVTTTHYDDDVALYLTPIVDGVAQEELLIELTGVPGTEREVRVHELSLLQPFMDDGVEVSRYAPRGTWIQVLARTQYAAGAAARQALDAVEVEFEVLRESKRHGEAST